MRWCWLAVLVVASACATSAPSDSASSSESDVAAVRAAFEPYLRGMHPPGDVEAMLAPFADSAQYMAAGEPTHRGKQAIREFFQGYVDALELGPTTTSIDDVRVSGDLALVTATATEEFTDRKTKIAMRDEFKGLGVLARQADGTWKVIYYMYNSDRPAPQVLPASDGR